MGSPESSIAVVIDDPNRAVAVADYLTANQVMRDRIATLGVNYQYPIASNDTAEGRQLNRRIQVFIENLLADS